MAGIKLNIGRSKPKQVSHQCNDRVSKSDKKKKSLFKSSSRQGSKQSSKRQDVPLDDSDATDRTDFSEFTLEDGLFSTNTTVDKMRRSNAAATAQNRPVCKELQVEENDTRPVSRRGGNGANRHNRQRSWIDSTWDGGSSCNFEEDADSVEDELDDSLYQLLDDDVDSPEQFKKLSLHNILVEEELSFQRSLVWNDDEK
jgi:hypothetical protein